VCVSVRERERKGERLIWFKKKKKKEKEVVFI
jgi:hypothetical protein